MLLLPKRLLALSVATCLALVLSTATWAQDEPKPIEEEMSAEERERTGIDKLSARELRALNAWLAERESAPTESESRPRAVADRRGFRARVADVFSGGEDTVINSRIIGTFDGWDGETLFELENGMVWKQAETNLYTVRPVQNPEVVIRQGLFDRWRLQVKGYNKRLTVERVQ